MTLKRVRELERQRQIFSQCGPTAECVQLCLQMLRIFLKGKKPALIVSDIIKNS